MTFVGKSHGPDQSEGRAFLAAGGDCPECEGVHHPCDARSTACDPADPYGRWPGEWGVAGTLHRWNGKGELYPQFADTIRWIGKRSELFRLLM